MAQDFAKHLYHSAAWKKNSRNYLKATLDRSGHVLRLGDDGWYYVEEGRQVNVPDGDVVPPGVCERCFSMGRMTSAKLVHHKEHLTPQNVDDPHIALSYENMQRLCQDCHAFVHSGQTESRVTFDEKGNVVPVEGDQLRMLIEQLTTPVDERRNIHRRNYAS